MAQREDEARLAEREAHRRQARTKREQEDVVALRDELHEAGLLEEYDAATGMEKVAILARLHKEQGE